MSGIAKAWCSFEHGVWPGLCYGTRTCASRRQHGCKAGTWRPRSGQACTICACRPAVQWDLLTRIAAMANIIAFPALASTHAPATLALTSIGWARPAAPDHVFVTYLPTVRPQVGSLGLPAHRYLPAGDAGSRGMAPPGRRRDERRLPGAPDCALFGAVLAHRRADGIASCRNDRYLRRHSAAAGFWRLVGALRFRVGFI